ncbi:sugar ABC transporter substrate-binding protein [Paenibacillus polygoni]|uniref:Sugar ABC transporter substrate-binding protein n=1 Tax=Paenibacillus polygoni TaxID=3050112 RepID=A0ABY8X496_9BACL|nr:sugar ABC transporter substrate-binding protein [Paenibacillus polygoni]WIV19058.1 sugar ABC transporter substrate-binding protein [Paenibacillus polygoni]
MRRNRKGMKLTCLTVLLLAMFISACSGGGGTAEPADPKPADPGKGEVSSEPVTLKFWTIALQPKFNDYFNKLITEYEAAHENVTIEWQDYPYDAITQKLLTSSASNTSPDVVNLNTEFANQMGTKGALVDLNEYLTAEEKAEYFDGIFDSTVLGDKAYALPWYTGTEVLFMNKKIVEAAGLDPASPPQTREELADWARTVKEKTGKMGYALNLVTKLLTIDGIPILNEDKSAAAFNTPEMAATVENLKKLMDEGLIVKEDSDLGKQVQFYSAEQTAFVLAGPTFINFIKTSAPEIYENTVAVSLPTGKAGLRLSNSMDLVVPSKSKHPKEAAEFAKFITNAENQTAFSKEANTLPSTKKSVEDPFFTESDGSLEAEAKLASSQSLDKATDHMVGVPNASDINSALARGLQDMLLNGKEIQATLKSMETEVNNILKQ